MRVHGLFMFAMGLVLVACSWLRSPQGAADVALAGKDVLCIIERANEPPLQIVKDCGLADDALDVVGQIAAKHKATSPHCSDAKGKTAMGNAAIEIMTSGGLHACQRQVGPGDVKAPFCGEPNCIDCLARAFADSLKEAGAVVVNARIVHWPGSDAPMVDDLLTGERQQEGAIPPPPPTPREGTQPPIVSVGTGDVHIGESTGERTKA